MQSFLLSHSETIILLLCAVALTVALNSTFFAVNLKTNRKNDQVQVYIANFDHTALIFQFLGQSFE